CRGNAGAAGSLQGTADRAARVRFELLGLWRRRAAPDARGRTATARVALRGDEAVGRAALPPVFRELPRPRRLDALFHGVRTAAAPGHGFPSVLPGGHAQ